MITDENTEGYSRDELAVLNEVAERLIREAADDLREMDPDNRADYTDHLEGEALGQHRPGDTVETLYRRVVETEAYWCRYRAPDVVRYVIEQTRSCADTVGAERNIARPHRGAPVPTFIVYAAACRWIEENYEEIEGPAPENYIRPSYRVVRDDGLPADLARQIRRSPRAVYPEYDR